MADTVCAAVDGHPSPRPPQYSGEQFDMHYIRSLPRPPISRALLLRHRLLSFIYIHFNVLQCATPFALEIFSIHHEGSSSHSGSGSWHCLRPRSRLCSMYACSTALVQGFHTDSVKVVETAGLALRRASLATPARSPTITTLSASRVAPSPLLPTRQLRPLLPPRQLRLRPPPLRPPPLRRLPQARAAARSASPA